MSFCTKFFAVYFTPLMIIIQGFTMENMDTFISSLNILYVEDEEIAREKLGKFLNKSYGKATLCENGAEGYELFKKAFEKDEKYDLILSDIYMPTMDGIEMLEKIRQLDIDVPFIFITGKSEIEQMIKAIDLNIEGYVLKPLNLDILKNQLEKTTKNMYYKATYENQKKEMQHYIDILNQEALVSKMDTEGVLTFVNESFCNASGFSEQELLGNSHKITNHPDISPAQYEEIWKILQSGQAWQGVKKSIAKDGSTFYVNTKIMPIFDISGKNIIEYISIRFLVTSAVNEKRNNRKKLIEVITDNKKNIHHMTEEIEKLNKEIKTLTDTLLFNEEKYKANEKKKMNLIKQLAEYEKNSRELSKKEFIVKNDQKKQFDEIYRKASFMDNTNKKVETRLKLMQKSFNEKTKELEELRIKDSESKSRIENLLDLVSNLEKENAKLKEQDSK